MLLRYTTQYCSVATDGRSADGWWCWTVRYEAQTRSAAVGGGCAYQGGEAECKEGRHRQPQGALAEGVAAVRLLNALLVAAGCTSLGGGVLVLVAGAEADCLAVPRGWRAPVGGGGCLEVLLVACCVFCEGGGR